MPRPARRPGRGVQLQSTCNLCPESHKTQVWLCFLALSFLSTSTCAAPWPGAIHLQTCLNFKRLKEAIEKSDAMLYSPSTKDVEENCKKMLLKCYILELMMVINEEEIKDFKADCIFDSYDALPEANAVGCPSCEAHSLKDITEFLEGLNTYLQEMNSRSMM
ncbi:interleukin-15 isoform X2 [Cottoperca gobio]|uniref:Interleukin n=1 Tax=Cottoperca gobio TaxID=56716 RepID=A0A6J2PQB2_COTGO|nr:interleukin-15-like isoform X2 [Cottoperca gobio]